MYHTICTSHITYNILFYNTFNSLIIIKKESSPRHQIEKPSQTTKSDERPCFYRAFLSVISPCCLSLSMIAVKMERGGARFGYFLHKVHTLRLHNSTAITSRKLTDDVVNHLVADSDVVRAAISLRTSLLDARTLGEFMGAITAHPNERAGTLPSAQHLPFDWLVDSSGNIRDKSAINILFKTTGLDTEQDGRIHCCHSGHRAALTWFADYAILGNHATKLYDGSMGEWAVRKELPIETRIDLTTDTLKN